MEVLNGLVVLLECLVGEGGIEILMVVELLNAVAGIEETVGILQSLFVLLGLHTAHHTQTVERGIAGELLDGKVTGAYTVSVMAGEET